MRIYEVRAHRTLSTGTLAEAHALAKEEVKGGFDWRNVEILEAEVSTEKANVLRLINMDGGTHQYLRSWTLKSARLGLDDPVAYDPESPES